MEPPPTIDAYTAIGQASIQVRQARELCDQLAHVLPSPALVLKGERITHELTDAAMQLQDAASKIRRLHIELVT